MDKIDGLTKLEIAQKGANAIIKALEDKDFYIDFEGFNCDEVDDNECPGWDGHSHRCECGNRRVSWEIEEDGENKFIAIARAY